MEYFSPVSKTCSMPKKSVDLIVDSTTLARERVTKLLGVFIDENVTWKTHVTQFPSRYLKA